MGTSAIRRRGLAFVGAVFLTVAGPGAGPAQASGGGGCGRPVTDAAGTQVTIRSYCFGPTIVRVAPGDTVTWINRDAASHSVLGANAVWGSFKTLRRTDEIAYRFARDGIYPYVCTYHPGMIGSVVVGDGTGPGAAGTLVDEDGPVTLEPASADVRQLVAQPSSGAESRPGAWRVPTLVSLGALALGTVAGLTLRRRRRPVSPPGSEGRGVATIDG